MRPPDDQACRRPLDRGRAALIQPRPTKIFFDGGCRPNPGEMVAAAVAAGDVHLVSNLGQGCAEEAEWLALLHALRVAKARGLEDVILLGDCASVIAAAAGRTKCRSAAMQAHRAAFVAEAKGFARVRLRHVRRTQNLAGIALDRMRR